MKVKNPLSKEEFRKNNTILSCDLNTGDENKLPCKVFRIENGEKIDAGSIVFERTKDPKKFKIATHTGFTEKQIGEIGNLFAKSRQGK